MRLPFSTLSYGKLYVKEDLPIASVTKKEKQMLDSAKQFSVWKIE